MGKVVVFYGPSCGGKTSVKEALQEKFKPIVTGTSRIPRDYEINGVHYYFYPREKFEANDGFFLETNEYLGNYYGVPFQSIEDTINSNETRVVVLDLNGALKVKEKFPENCQLIYIGANKESLLRRFLEERKSSNDEVMSRLAKAIKEETTQAYYGYADEVIWNNDGCKFEDTLQKVLEVI